MRPLTDYEIHTMFREWYKATTNHEADTQQTVLFGQFARAVLNRATSRLEDDQPLQFGGTE